MNKNDILDFWIDIEKFSEGNIDLKAGGNTKYKHLRRAELIDNWTYFFRTKSSDVMKNISVAQCVRFIPSSRVLTF